jgi:mannan endo-1,4-beta-mannosidase
MNLKFISLALAGLISVAASADRYEAENAIIDENSVQKVTDEIASGGYYVNMKEGGLSFKTTVNTAGFYTLWAFYSQVGDSVKKVQNLSVNGISTGQIDFPFTTTFQRLKASIKINLPAGANTIEITKSWGWVNIDYVELTPYEDITPFNINTNLVTPNASENARKVFGFLSTNFQKKVVSGVMTSDVMQTDGKYTPDTVENQTEVAWIINASGKTPALLGVDFIHATGKNSESEWHQGYTRATVSLAENLFKKGGIPAYCWHWKDPDHAVEAFYTKSSGNTPFVSFNLNNAYVDSTTCEAFNTTSDEYKAIIRDIDIVAVYFKTLADKGVPVLWRPVHEASGKWFWWGERGPKACRGLYRLMFDRMVNFHKLNNLIWVWTTDEAGDALEWYPGDDYVDIVGRDFYYYPRIANHGSLAASFEKVKEIFKGKKLVALSENGSVPYPDNLVKDGAGWSYFMPWNLDWTMDGWAHDNTAADWKLIMNHDYVITLDEMPGWSQFSVKTKSLLQKPTPGNFTINYERGILKLTLQNERTDAVEIYNLKGTRVAILNQGRLTDGSYRFDISNIAKGIYLVHVKSINSSQRKVMPFIVK